MSQDKIWEAYQNDPELQVMGYWDGGRISFISKQVKDVSRVLNIGVGVGTLEAILLNKGFDVYCLDPSETSISHLRMKLGLGDKARAGYSQAIPFDDAFFECVIMTEVLEHLTDEILNSTLDEVFRVLNPGGVFIGSVPADECLMENLVICPKCGEHFHRWGHQQSYSRERLTKLLNLKFKNVNVQRMIFPDYKNLNWKGKFSAILRGIQARFDIKGTAQNFYFKAVKN
jgi:2-polyprenyl-3-methyl-5-hydroxy-6-metoxy-1,4-benzoquinol methylase